jgi:hypothetical protein
MRTLARAVSYPAEVALSEGDGLYYFTATFEDIILSDTAGTVTEAAEEIVRFLTFWAAQKGHSFGVVRDIAETLAVVVANETGQHPRVIYRKLVNL